VIRLSRLLRHALLTAIFRGGDVALQSCEMYQRRSKIKLTRRTCTHAWKLVG
jgi:hypothetical protein